MPDLAKTQRPAKVQWLEEALRNVLVIDDRGDGWPAVGRVKTAGGWKLVALHVSLVIGSGQGRSDPDECRIEPKTEKGIMAPPGALPLVIGVLAGDPTPRTIVVWDGRPRLNVQTRGSLYARWSGIRLAADKGFYEHSNTKGERIVAMDVEQLPGLVEELATRSAAEMPSGPSTQLAAGSVGVPFVPIAHRPRKPADPFAVDPERVERGTIAHAVTLTALGKFLAANGIAPLAPAPDDPEFDLAWTNNGCVYVAEVKSVTDANEDKQLRMGLGQVLWYRHLLSVPTVQVRAVLVAEREPRDGRWYAVCATCGVLLTWPERFAQVLTF